MIKILAVAVGGAIGALCRYAVSLVCLYGFARQPWVVLGTLCVNVVGCFLIGLLFAREISHPTVHHAAIAIGFLGALTTFSSFGLETVRFLQTGRPGWAVANIAANMLLGLAAVYGGIGLGRA